MCKSHGVLRTTGKVRDLREAGSGPLLLDTFKAERSSRKISGISGGIGKRAITELKSKENVTPEVLVAKIQNTTIKTADIQASELMMHLTEIDDAISNLPKGKSKNHKRHRREAHKNTVLKLARVLGIDVGPATDQKSLRKEVVTQVALELTGKKDETFENAVKILRFLKNPHDID